MLDCRRRMRGCQPAGHPASDGHRVGHVQRDRHGQRERDAERQRQQHADGHRDGHPGAERERDGDGDGQRHGVADPQRHADGERDAGRAPCRRLALAVNTVANTCVGSKCVCACVRACGHTVVGASEQRAVPLGPSKVPILWLDPLFDWGLGWAG